MRVVQLIVDDPERGSSCICPTGKRCLLHGRRLESSLPEPVEQEDWVTVFQIKDMKWIGIGIAAFVGDVFILLGAN